ncbi:S-layer homology domain-containing protein [Lysinibacillus mangiferihumi]|uniref:S-layer homology domain-containing protein n=1 Tax=Lysinibacillus mangiferihumi TaxID=1130819 RepID=A0A4U2YQC1_9BACI|nr:S-layer homology domain-containing protein [Lysinibacillus mangiferihumi]TKI63616.1 S-layer homology domain-containing protein [Lysinibacillus mangiferihumi]
MALGDDGYFKPNDPLTRAQFGALMYRAMNR